MLIFKSPHFEYWYLGVGQIATFSGTDMPHPSGGRRRQTLRPEKAHWRLMATTQSRNWYKRLDVCLPSSFGTMERRPRNCMIDHQEFASPWMEQHQLPRSSSCGRKWCWLARPQSSKNTGERVSVPLPNYKVVSWQLLSRWSRSARGKVPPLTSED